jgi:hypothetical protein
MSHPICYDADTPPKLAAQRGQLDLSKPVCTRDGCHAGIIETAGDSAKKPIVAIVHLPDGARRMTYTLEGKFSPSTGAFVKLDLVNTSGQTMEEAIADWQY